MDTCVRLRLWLITVRSCVPFIGNIADFFFLFEDITESQRDSGFRPKISVLTGIVNRLPLPTRIFPLMPLARFNCSEIPVEARGIL